jgi:hypothetical protein
VEDRPSPHRHFVGDDGHSQAVASQEVRRAPRWDAGSALYRAARWLLARRENFPYESAHGRFASNLPEANYVARLSTIKRGETDFS